MDDSILTQTIEKYRIDPKTSRLVTQYYTHFARALNLQNPIASFRKSVAQTALIFAQKSISCFTLLGQKVPGICFSINNILKSKSCSEIKNLVSVCKNVLEKVSFKDVLFVKDLHKLTKQIEGGLEQVSLFEKLCSAFLKNTLETSNQAQKYKRKLINFSWYLYISAKRQCLPKQTESIYEKFLMVSVLETVILNSLQHITPLILHKYSPVNYDLGISQQKKQVMSSILEILLREAEINPSDIFEYQQVSQYFDNYFDSLVTKGKIKSSSDQNFDFLCERVIDSNFRKLDCKINKEIQPNQIDLRKLISDELEMQKDHKKTAIEDKLIVKHNKANSSKIHHSDHTKKYKSHRVLDLNNCEIEMNSSSVINESDVTLPSNIKMQPSIRLSVPNLHHITQKDEVTRFILEKTRFYIKDEKQYQKSILSYIEDAFDKMMNEKNLVDTVNDMRKSFHHKIIESFYQAYEFYSFLSEQVWLSDETQNQYILEQSDSTHQCLLIVAIGTIILSQSEKQAPNPFSRLIILLKPNVMDLFNTLIYLQQLYFPPELRTSLNNLMKILINEKIWKEEELIEQTLEMSELLGNFQLEEEIYCRPGLSCIMQRVQKYVSQKVQLIEERLKRDQNTFTSSQLRSLRTTSIQLCLWFVVYCPQIVAGRILDQIILCSLFGTSRLLKMPIKFHTLLEAYKTTVAIGTALFEQTILSFQGHFEETPKDIIAFYNNEFVSYLNCAYEVLNRKEQMSIVYGIYGMDGHKVHYRSPLKYGEGTILLSPRLRKSNSQAYGLKALQSIQKQNIDQNTNHSININLDSEGQIDAYSYNSEQVPFSTSSQFSENSNKIEINLQIKPTSRDPTRVKQRKSIMEREHLFCDTQRQKHPIFQLRED